MNDKKFERILWSILLVVMSMILAVVTFDYFDILSATEHVEQVDDSLTLDATAHPEMVLGYQKLPKLEPGWHDGDQAEVVFLSHTSVRVKLDDGCEATWSDTRGYWWTVYKHPITIDDREGKIVYLPREVRDE